MKATVPLHNASWSGDFRRLTKIKPLISQILSSFVSEWD